MESAAGFQALALPLTVFLLVPAAMNGVCATLYGVSGYISNLTSQVPNATYSTTLPTNFGYAISSYAASYALWAVIIAIIGLAMYVAYSFRR
mgnify:CR=1 FL=1